MPINRDLSDVPRKTDAGLPPSKNPFAVTELARAWWERYENENAAHAIPDAGPYRASYASIRCDRQLYYALTGAEPTNAPTIADIWRMSLGELVHRELQSAYQAAFPTAERELVVDLRPLGIPGSGRADLVDGDLFVEVKTINGFSFKMIATSFKGPAQGPRHGAVAQTAIIVGALIAAGHQIERVVVGYLSLELVGPGMIDVTHAADDDLAREIARFTAEWHFTTDELRPIWEYEQARIARLLRAVDAGLLPARELHDPEYPAGAIVTAPKVRDATWQVLDGDLLVDAGTTWMCGYCRHRDACATDGPGDTGGELEI